MLEELRQQANEAAQRTMRDMVAYMVRHQGRRNPALEDAYRAAERVVDAVDELSDLVQVAAQAADDEAPDYQAIYAEGDLRAYWGNR